MHRGSATGTLGVVLSIAVLLASGQGIITTVAGGGGFFRGDGDAAVHALLGEMDGIAVDRAGNVYASDLDHHLVVKISPDGILTVVAGNGIAGFSGDGGPGNRASITMPFGVAVDTSGNLYIVDNSQRIRKVTPDGRITTVAGNGQIGLSGDGGPAIEASLRFPRGVAVDAAGNLYIADTFNHRIRKVDSQGIITTVAGSGPTGNGNGGYAGDGGPAINARLNEAFGIIVDGAGNLYFTDRGNNRIRKITSSGTITTIGGGGPCCATLDGVAATNTHLNGPYGLALDGAGNLYFGENGSFVRKIGPDGILTPVAGISPPGFSGDGGSAAGAALYVPKGVAVDAAGNLYVADSFNNRIRKVTGGIISTLAGLGPQGFGDGGPASSAALSRPRGVVLDASGNLYISEARGHRVRRVSPNGIIATVAGNGIAGFSGDGGLAPSASLNQPQGIALDASGNLYIADQNNGRIRRVTPAGIISTVAGGGSAQPGDGGPALNASLYPSDVEVDAAGNLYIASNSLNRVQKVDRNGIITTVAGNGIQGFSGDGGLATAASLNIPSGIALDSAGNLYIADTTNFRVRKVTPAGIIYTVAGSGTTGSFEDGPAVGVVIGSTRDVTLDAAGNLYILGNGAYKVDPRGILMRLTGAGGFSGDGGLAVNAKLSIAEGIVLDPAGNLYIADTNNDRVRKILAAAPALSLAPSSLSFTATAGTAPSAAQQVTVSSAITGVPWSVTASTTSGGNWLSVSPAAGSTPGTIAVSVDASTLAPGAYQGTITVTASLAAPPVQTIPVQLTVSASVPAQFFVNSTSLTFQNLQGSGNPPAQILRIGNAGSGTLAWTAQASTQSGGNWLAVGPGSGSASAAFPASAQVTVNVAGLAAGVYSGSVTITAAALQQTQTVAVTLLISPVTQTILLSQSGLTFIGVEDSASAPPQSFGILNTGQGTMSWTVDASTLSGGNWLSVSPTSGSTTANTLQIPIVDVRVSLRGLRSGQYTGTIRVNATGANNSPQYVIVELTVLPAGSNPGVQARPTGLIFAAQAGGNSPSSQNVRLATGAAGNVEARSGLQTFDGASWLEALPRNGVLSSSDLRTITVQPSLGSLAPGVYRAALTFLFSDDTPLQTVNVLFLVVSSTQGADGPGAAAGCVPQRLHAVHRSLSTNFVSPVARPAAIEVQVVDDCGNPANNATVVASFSNGDPSLPLASLGGGIYSGTWRPVNAASLAVVRVRADLSPLTATEVTAQGQVSANSSATALFAGGMVNAASFAPNAALAPGQIVSVFGRNLATSGGATTLPLPTSLGGASLSIGGVDVPLFYAGDGQINAQIPFELAAATRPQVVVKRGTSVAGPETITVAAVAPGIFTTNQQGTGQGAILDTRGQLVDGASPVAAGDVVQVYCTGLGLTNPRATTGQAPGALSITTIPVTATIGGRPATVQFAGLAPGFVGLYQVNVQVPTGVAAGSAALVLSQNGVPSNSVTLAVR